MKELYPQYTARGPWSLFAVLLQCPPPAPLWMRARACVWLCVSQVWARTHLTSFMSIADREEEKTGIFIPMRAWRFGLILAFKVALEDTCMLLAWGCHRQHLFCAAGDAPQKHSFALYLIFTQKLFIQQELDSSEVLDTWAIKWNRCASWCVHRCIHKNQTTVILRTKHDLGLRVYNPFP